MLNKKLCIMCIVFFIAGISGCNGSKGQSKLETIPVKINNIEFTVEVARTSQEQKLGLMSRESMGELEGMIFVYDRDKKMTFYMKNTLLPLSIAFISADGIITQIEDMKPLSQETIISRKSVRYALEVNQGIFEKHRIKVGDKLLFPEGFPD